MNLSVYNAFCSFAPPSADEGVVVASDLTQEWLLPWWFSHYKKHNNHPVTFVDLGLSKEMKAWCKEHGHLAPLPVPDLFVKEKEELSLKQIALWEKRHGTHFWENRKGWFKKPLACLQAPYKRSIWLDSDCEVRGDLSPLFSKDLSPHKVMVAKEYLEGGGKGVNSGVLVFETDCPLILEWAKEAFAGNARFVGDQDILSHLIEETGVKPKELPPIYNWSRFSGENPEAIVMHWHGNHGKKVIAHQITKQNLEIFS